MAFKTADWARHYPALLNKRRTNKSVFRLFCCTGLLLTGNGSAIVSLTIKDPLSTKSLSHGRRRPGSMGYAEFIRKGFCVTVRLCVDGTNYENVEHGVGLGKNAISYCLF
ncbi:hypothetical protein CDAR_408971 [Caerostris darwini]|uniref:Uncharacterized protein n=1 Tax=Caerostris darwini TaxID=1538125 RepID=A0AAV4PBU9_9ARAC|nr:hypothetical protein CDAR_408971 [Caerostris darwini]